MKYNLSFLISMTVILSLSACDVLNVEPEQSVSTDQVFTTVQGAEAVLTGAYSGLQNPGSYGGFALMAADFTTDNSIHIGSFTTWEEVRLFNISTDNGTTAQVWNNNYSAINRANNIIKFIDDVPDITTAARNSILGQAHFIRAAAYFQLVKWFGQPYGFTNDNSHLAVSIVTEPGEGAGEQNFIPRSTVSQVYNLILSDLQIAEEIGPVTLAGQSALRGRGTRGAAQGLMSRVYLYMSDWANAAAKANDVLTSQDYALLGDPSSFFSTKNTSEDVFAIQFSAENNPGVNNAMAALHQPLPRGGRGDIPATQTLLDLFEPGDLRRSDLIFELDDNHWTNKYTDPNNADNVHIVRVAEVALTRAEALVRNTNAIQAESVTIVNQIRTRAGLEPVVEGTDFSNAAELLDIIMKERRLELVFEGHYRFDRLRLGLGLISSSLETTIPYGDNRMVFPIPQREMDLNPNLVQNPGY